MELPPPKRLRRSGSDGSAAEAARNAFVARWGLDDQAQDLLMNAFSKENFIKAFKYAFIQAVERIVDRPIRCTDSRRVLKVHGCMKVDDCST